MGEQLQLIRREENAPQPTLRDVVALLFRQRRLIVITFVIVFAGIVLYGVVSPTYTAEMKVLVRRGRIDPMAGPNPSQTPQVERDDVTQEDLNSEADLLQDQDLLSEVVRRTELDSSQAWLWNLLGESEDMKVARAAKRLGKKLQIEPVKKATLITVSYDSSDPQRAASVLQSVGAAYLEKHEKVRRPSGEFAFFDQQAKQSQAALEDAEWHLMQFARDEGVVSASLERDISLQKASQADTDQQQAQVAIAESAQRIRSLQNKLQALPENATIQTRNLDNPQLMEKLKSKLLDLRLKRTELLTKFGSSYRLVHEADEEIAQAKAAIDAEEQAPLREQTIEHDVNHEWAKSELLHAQVELNVLLARSAATKVVLADDRSIAQELGARAIQQEELLRILKSAEDRYVLYTDKREEARIGDALDQGGILNVTIAEPASIPALPAHSAMFFVLAALVAGTVTSTGAAFAADYLSPAFRTPEEILGYLGMPVLASLPGKDF